MFVVRALTDVDVAAAELDQPLDRFPLIVEGCGRQIEVEPVRPCPLRLRDRPEIEPEPGSIGRHDTDHITGLVADLPAQRLRPEARQTRRIVRIEAQSNELRSHFGSPTLGFRMTGYLRSHRSEPVAFDGHDFSTIDEGRPSVTQKDELGARRRLVVSGISHSFVTTGVALLFPDLVPMQLDPVLAPRQLRIGYLTTRVGSREAHFYYSPTADPQVVALDEATKESGTTGEVATLPTALPFSRTIHAPVLLIDGDRDQLICGLIPCSSPLSLFRTERTFYPSAASYSEVLLPATDHDIALQTTAPEFATAVDAWIDAHV